MRFWTLADWLAWQETHHPKAIDLGLERTAIVADAMQLRASPAPTTITVAGTNGKGTVATMVAAFLEAMGFRVGLYTSPHLLRYNERIRVGGHLAQDAEICRAFDRIDRARGSVSLTYFEFGTLAAVLLFREHAVDFQVLEVGLGGRLDTVNVWDPDLTVITGVDVDHEEWLGSDRESIGREKAGILRAGRPLVLGDPDPPKSVLAAAQALHVPVFRQDQDFALDAAVSGGRWRWLGDTAPLQLPVGLAPGLEGARERNAGTALAVLHALGLQNYLTPKVLQAGLGAKPPGRLERIPGQPEWLLDVAHNPQSARELARWLRAHPVKGATVAIVGFMADKRRAPMFEALADCIDAWIPIPIASPRALGAAELVRELRGSRAAEVLEVGGVEQAIAEASVRCGPHGRVVAFGSFVTVQAVVEALSASPGALLRA